MIEVITVNRRSLYNLLVAFELGKSNVLALCDTIQDPDNPIRVLIQEFNLSVEHWENAGKLKVVK